ncbi:MAG: inorganic phosphate transporter [Nocardioides sp.]|nr:inorganic phosphate transporter [Nocardioides sp.]
MTLAIIIAVVVIALVFDYTNGFHDAANAIATSVSTRALTPRIALLLAGGMNFVGAFLGQHVARTVSSTVDLSGVAGAHGLVIVLSGLLGAIAWNLLTWCAGLPSSSTHALIGGLVGAALAAGVPANWHTVLTKVVVPMLVSPVVAFAIAFAVMLAILWIFRRTNQHRAQRGFRAAQTVSAAAMALGHGLQDAQKTMGVIFLALLTGGYVTAGAGIPLWVVACSAAAISLGTWSGGWRIMRTLGRRIIHLDPAHGFAAETVAAVVLYVTAYVWQAPISTTHTITSAIMGVGATRRRSAVRWGVARSIVVAWILTAPAAAAAAALAYLLCTYVLQLP